MSEIKLCPLCDGEIQDEGEFCACGNPDCELLGYFFTKEVWNTRPIEDALRIENEALKAKVEELEKNLPAEYLQTQTGLPKYVAKLEADNARMRGAFRTIVEGFDVIDSLSIAKNILEEVSK